MRSGSALPVSAPQVLTEQGVRTARHLGVYGAAQVGQGLLALVLVATLARAMGREGFGQFSLALVIASLGGLIADFGLGPWLTRAVAQSPSSSASLLRDVVGLRVRLVLVSWAITLVASAIYLKDPVRVMGVAAMLGYVTVIGYVVLYESLLIGRGYVGRVALSVFGGKALELSAVALWFVFGGHAQVAYVAAALAAGCLVRLAFAWRLSRVALVPLAGAMPRAVDPVAAPEPSASLPLLVQVFPFALGAWMWTAYFKSDVLILERLSTPVGLGLYTAAYRVIEALMLVPRAVVGVSYPIVSAAWSEGTLTAGMLARPGRLLALVSLAAGAGLWVLAPETMQFLFSSSFVEGAAALRVLALCVPIIFMNQYLGMLLPATHRQNAWVALLGIALVLNVITNLILIPILDIRGAAWATMASECFSLAGCAVLVARRHGWFLPPGWLIRALAAAAGMGWGVSVIPGPLVVRVAAGAALFVGLALALRAVTIEDRSLGAGLLRRIFGRASASSAGSSSP